MLKNIISKDLIKVLIFQFGQNYVLTFIFLRLSCPRSREKCKKNVQPNKREASTFFDLNLMCFLYKFLNTNPCFTYFNCSETTTIFFQLPQCFIFKNLTNVCSDTQKVEQPSALHEQRQVRYYSGMQTQACICTLEACLSQCVACHCT